MRRAEQQPASGRAVPADACAADLVDPARAIQSEALTLLIARLHEASHSDDAAGFNDLIRASQKLIGLSV